MVDTVKTKPVSKPVFSNFILITSYSLKYLLDYYPEYPDKIERNRCICVKLITHLRKKYARIPNKKRKHSFKLRWWKLFSKI